MARMPTITSAVMIEFLKSLGFRHPDGRTATVPFHKGEDLGRGLTDKILKDVELTREDFQVWYRRR